MTPRSKWDERYSEAGYAYGTEPNDFLAASLKQLPPAGKVLCLGDGEGRNSVFLARQGYTVTAVDYSTLGLQKAQRLAADRGVTITTHVADLAEYQLLPDTYNAVISIFCHLPPPVRRQVHGQIPSSLKKNGVFLLEGYTPRQLNHGTGGPPVKELLLEIIDLKKELAQLQITHLLEVEREIHEGRLHTGLGAVAQLIAVKM
ncbi:class I SAM-dependent methyltransferase [Desulfopila sp. IMCC35006]|uniref:SAM-dependent methyltransferase n=1 Tax=Desulfopila sp. IMCC35006 TaxID=2569542 RepID=UPI0010AC945A|nr:class I SAM-dependent methyltransferase [Desulfopila sp. IMCC35006]TKB25561.1 class I SAM-dependent methyltransferase [Desulfopila sp. IMCC35006]